jgi:hypothetical protein
MDIKCICCGKDGSGGEPLVMHGRCHVDSPTYVTLEVDMYPGRTVKKFTIYCSQCDKKIAPFIVECEPGLQLDSTCHPGAEVWVMLHGKDVLTINCAKCEEPFATLKLVGYAPKE